MLGFVDYDLMINSKLSVPNLEILKMTSYYKTEEKQFCRLLSLEEDNLSMYDKIFFFSERHSCDVPKNFLKASNVEYRGLAFTKGEYRPFDNELMEYVIPRTFLYKEFLRKSYNDGVKAASINHFLDDAYYRMYAGDKKLPLPPMMPNKRIFLYDKDFFYDDWQDILNEIIERKPSSIMRVHPITCCKVSQYFALRSYQKFARGNDIFLDIPIPLDQTHILFNRFERKFLGDINASSRVFIPFGGDLPTKIGYYKDFLYKVNLLYCFWAKGILLKLKFIPPSAGFLNPIQTLSESVESWSNLSSKKKMEDKFMDRMPKRKKKSLQLIWTEYECFKKVKPEISDLLNHSYIELKNNKVWRP